MAVNLLDLLADLRAETDELVAILGVTTPEEWDALTPSEGWTVRDQISHLAYFDDAVTLALTDPDKFRAEAAELMELGETFPDQIAARYRHLSPEELTTWLENSRAKMFAEFPEVDPKARIPWYGPDMSVASAITARLMETWAHGQDIADATNVFREPSRRLKHIAEIGVLTFAFAHNLNGRPVPKEKVRVELVGPRADIWTWGPEEAENRVLGTAKDFCLVVTQRRHRDDTGLIVIGPVAEGWMEIAQAFAGAPGKGRPAGMFPAEDDDE